MMDCGVPEKYEKFKDDWFLITTSLGFMFYYNSTEKKSQWTKPEDDSDIEWEIPDDDQHNCYEEDEFLKILKDNKVQKQDSFELAYSKFMFDKRVKNFSVGDRKTLFAKLKKHL